MYGPGARGCFGGGWPVTMVLKLALSASCITPSNCSAALGPAPAAAAPAAAAAAPPVELVELGEEAAKEGQQGFHFHSLLRGSCTAGASQV